jgi:hypothetical protein
LTIERPYDNINQDNSGSESANALSILKFLALTVFDSRIISIQKRTPRDTGVISKHLLQLNEVVKELIELFSFIGVAQPILNNNLAFASFLT